MQQITTEDKKMRDLLGRVGEDIKQLKSDVSSLVTHTGRHTIPDYAGELRNAARERLNAGGEFASNQFRCIREHPAQSTAGILGGLLLIGVVSTALYCLIKCDSETEQEE